MHVPSSRGHQSRCAHSSCTSYVALILQLALLHQSVKFVIARTPVPAVSDVQLICLGVQVTLSFARTPVPAVCDVQRIRLGIHKFTCLLCARKVLFRSAPAVTYSELVWA